MVCLLDGKERAIVCALACPQVNKIRDSFFLWFDLFHSLNYNSSLAGFLFYKDAMCGHKTRSAVRGWAISALKSAAWQGDSSRMIKHMVFDGRQVGCRAMGCSCLPAGLESKALF